MAPNHYLLNLPPNISLVKVIPVPKGKEVKGATVPTIQNMRMVPNLDLALQE